MKIIKIVMLNMGTQKRIKRKFCIVKKIKKLRKD